jgi:hypothetical protein
MRLCVLLCAASGFALLVQGARAETRVAFSEKLGIEVLAANPAWCAERVAFRIAAADKGVFAEPGFAALLQRFGQGLVAKACPAARTARLTGTDRAGAPVWHGTAAAASQWALEASPATQEKAAVLDAPPPAVPLQPAAVAAAPGVGPTSPDSLADDPQRHQAALAAAARADVRTQLAALPETPESLARARTLAAGFAATVSAIDAQPILEAAAERRREIGQSLVEAAVKAIKAEPHTLDGIIAAQQRAAAMSQMVAQDLPDAPATLDTAVARLKDDSAPAILAAAVSSLKTASATLDGARAISARHDEIKRLIGFDAPGGDAYETAANARLATIGEATEPDLDARLAALAPGWDAVAQARQLARDAAAPFGSAPVAQEIAGLGQARAQALEAALASQILEAIRARQAASVLDVMAAYGDEDKAAPFAADRDGTDAADSVRQAARQQGDSLAAAFLPAYRDEIGKIPPSHAAAFRLARAAVLLDRATKVASAFAPYRDATKAAALAAQSSACVAAVRRFGVSGAQANLPMVIGGQTRTLGAFVCGLADAGVRRGTLDAPGLFSFAHDYALTLVVPAGGLVPPRSDPLDAEGKDPQALARAFDFHDLTAPEPARVPGQAPEVSRKFVLRRVAVGGSGETALVGVQADQGGKMEDIAVEQWRQISGTMTPGGEGTAPDLSTCDAYAAQPDRLAPNVAARALLACPEGRTLAERKGDW